MSKFGWSYPPGCFGVPDDEVPDPPAESIRTAELLEAAGVEQDVIDAVCRIVDQLAAERDAECPQCLERWAAELREAEGQPGGEG